MLCVPCFHVWCLFNVCTGRAPVVDRSKRRSGGVLLSGLVSQGVGVSNRESVDPSRLAARGAATAPKLVQRRERVQLVQPHHEFCQSAGAAGAVGGGSGGLHCGEGPRVCAALCHRAGRQGNLRACVRR